ncbi:polyprotein [Hymenoscyphus fraxineus endornavirus 1]|nr:polyprotein [Hymenoscyphus fraxineus endornavirus 1]
MYNTNTTMTSTMTNTTPAATTNTHKRAIGALYKYTPLKNFSRGEYYDTNTETPLKQTNNAFKLKKPVKRINPLTVVTDPSAAVKIGGCTQVKASFNCWQCIFGYDLGIDTPVRMEMIKMTAECDPESASHIQVRAWLIGDMLHIANPIGLPVGPPSDELFKAQREFVSKPIDGCIKLTALVDLFDDGVLVGYAPTTLLDKLANDTGLQLSDINTNQFKNSISTMVNKRVSDPLTTFIGPPIILPSSCPDDLINDLNTEFGNMTFIRGNKEHHPHRYHNASRKAVTNLIYRWHGHRCLVYDIGGNPAAHLNAGRLNVHSVYSKSSAADNARHIKWVKQAVAWANRNVNSDNSDSTYRAIASSILTENNAMWCDKGVNGCVHASKDGSFAMSVDTLCHIEVDDLFDFYMKNKVIHAVHAFTIPKDYSYASSGALPYNEGHWYRNSSSWTIEFNGESLPYTQSTELTNKYLTIPLYTLGEMVVYCKIGGYKGAHMIIEHFVMPRSELDSLYIKHVTWFNTDMDELFVMIPKVNMDESNTLMGRTPYEMEKVVINVRFYERILNRLMQAYTWESLLSYGSGLIGRVYATSSGLHMKWNLTNTQVRQHCLIAYWTTNRLNESIRPLLAQAERNQRDPDFLTSLWNSLKTWVKDFGSQFDPSGNVILQKFIADNKGDTLRLVQLFNSSARSIESLNVATQMVHSRSVTDWIATSTGVTYNNQNFNIDKWRLSQPKLNYRPVVYDLVHFRGAKFLGDRVKCTPSNNCKHDHGIYHLHILNAIKKTGKCSCCNVESNLNRGGVCSCCSERSPCVGKNLRCPHEHNHSNDECCNKEVCFCNKPNSCNCCGMPSIYDHCEVCKFTPAAQSIGPIFGNPPTNGPNNLSKINHNVPNQAVNGPTNTTPPVTTTGLKTFAFVHGNTSNGTPHSQTPIPSSPVINPVAEPNDTVYKFNPAPTDSDAVNSEGSITPPVTERAKPLFDTTVSDFDALASKNWADDSDLEEIEYEQVNSSSIATKNDNEESMLPLVPEDEIIGAENISQIRCTNVTIVANRGYGPSNLSLLPPNYEGGLAVRVTGYTDVPGDGTCGAHALAKACELPIKSVKTWLGQAVNKDDWQDAEELGACAVAFGKNVIVVEEGITTLFRGSDSNVAGSIVFAEVITTGMHWVAGNCDIQSYSSLYNSKIRENYKALLSACQLTLDGSVSSAYAYHHSTMDIAQILDIDGQFSVDDTFVAIHNRGSKPKCTISNISNGIKYITGPTGSGKTTAAFNQIKGRVLIVTPLRSAVTSTYTFLKKKSVRVIGRADQAWLPPNTKENEVLNADVVILTMETLYSGIFLSGNKKNVYHNLVKSRHIICDEVHEISPHYARLIAFMPREKLYVCSATLPGIKTSYECQHDIDTCFAQKNYLKSYFDDAVKNNSIQKGECYIVPTVAQCSYANQPRHITSLNSKTMAQIDLNTVNCAIATNIVTTSVTLPNVIVMTDLGERTQYNMIFNPYKTEDPKKIRFANYTQRDYSWAEMCQSRGRIGRVKPGKFYGPPPTPSTQQSNVDEMLMSCYVGSGCNLTRIDSWKLLSRLHFNEIVDYFTPILTKLQDNDLSNQFQQWQDNYMELLACKDTGVSPVFVQDSVSKENVLSLISNFAGTLTTSVVRQGPMRYNCRIEWEHILPSQHYSKNDNIDFDNLTITIDSTANLINLNTDDNQTLSSKLRILAISQILTTIRGLRDRGQVLMNRNKWGDQTGQYIAYSNFQEAINLSGVKLGPTEIIGLLDSNANQLILTTYSKSTNWKDAVLIPNYRTNHYITMVSEASILRDNNIHVLTTLQNSTLIAGPSGSGKTTKMLENNPGTHVVTISNGQLYANPTWITPAQLPPNQEVVCVDEVGLMDVATLITICAKAKKIVCTGDIGQIVHNTNEEIKLFTGVNDTMELISEHMTVETLSGTWRFGETTCSMLRNLGFNVTANDKSKKDTVNGHVVNYNDLKSYGKLLIDTSPDAIICSTNKLARVLRSITKLPVFNITKCQGIEAPKTLVLLQDISAGSLADRDLYVALTRHSSELTIVVDPIRTSILTRLKVRSHDLISYANAAGGAGSMTLPMKEYLIRLMFRQMAEVRVVAEILGIITAWQGNIISNNTLLAHMDNLNDRNHSHFKFSEVGFDDKVGCDVVTLRLHKKQVVLFKSVHCTPSDNLLTCINQLPMGTLVSRALLRVPGAIINLSASLLRKIGFWLINLMSSVSHVLDKPVATVPEEIEMTSVGGKLDLTTIIWYALTGAKWAIVTLRSILLKARDTCYSWTNGNTAGAAVKKLMLNMLYDKDTNTFVGYTIGKKLKELLSILSSSAILAGKGLWTILCTIYKACVNGVKSMYTTAKNNAEWMRTSFLEIYIDESGSSDTDSFYMVPDITHLDDTWSDTEEVMKSLIPGDDQSMVDELVTEIEEHEEKLIAAQAAESAQQCEDNKVMDEVDMLFDFEEELLSVGTPPAEDDSQKATMPNVNIYDQISNDYTGAATPHGTQDSGADISQISPSPHDVEPVDGQDSHSNPQSTTHIERKRCKCSTIEDKWEYIQTLETEVNINTFTPNFFGRSVIQRNDKGLSVKLSMPLLPQLSMVTERCCDDDTHVVMATDKDGITYFKLVRCGEGYNLYVQPGSGKINPQMIARGLQYISKLGGSQGPSFMSLIKNMLSATKDFIDKLAILSKYKIRYALGQITMQSFSHDASCIHVYRAIRSSLPKSWFRSGIADLTIHSGTTISTIEIKSVDQVNSHKDILVVIYQFFSQTTVSVFCNTESRINFVGRVLRKPVDESISGGDKNAISALLQLGIDIRSIIERENDLTETDVMNWLVNNPLTSLFGVSSEPTYLSCKESLSVEKHLLDDFKYSLDIKGKEKVAFCIPSGHGKTTTVARIRREMPNHRVLDADEVQEQATILLLEFDDKMRNYREKIIKHIKSDGDYDALFIHSPMCAPPGYRPIVLMNSLAVVPADRIWSEKNVAHLNVNYTVHSVKGYNELFHTCRGYLERRLSGDITLEDGSTIIDNVNSILGDSFMRNAPFCDDILRLPSGKKDKLLYSEGVLGVGQQRVFKTGPHVEVMRPTINSVSTALPNAITTRLMGRVKYRTMDLKIHDYDALLSKMFAKDYKYKLRQYEEDTINLNYKDILAWLVNKGNKIELLDNMVRNVLKDEHATDPANISVHYKVENLMKEQVNDILDQVGRVIVWNNQNINMYACPVINEAKARFKTLLKSNVIYTDGMTIEEINNSISEYRGRWLLEMDLSKQDRQTDAQILKYEWDLMRRLGVPYDLIDFMTSFIPTFRIRGSGRESAKLPAIHFSGGAMTSLGNEIRNLLLLSDCLNSKFVAIYTLGDDSLVIMDTEPDLKFYSRVSRARHNVENTATASRTCALFLQLIVCRNSDDSFYCSHNFVRLREKIAYSSYPNTSSDWKMKYASYLMMIGYSTQTMEAMQWCGFVAFPTLGTTMSMRVSANAIYNEVSEEAILSVINDIINARHQESEAILLDVPMVLSGNKLLSGFKKAGDYVDNHVATYESIADYVNNVQS